MIFNEVGSEVPLIANWKIRGGLTEACPLNENPYTFDDGLSAKQKVAEGFMKISCLLKAKNN